MTCIYNETDILKIKEVGFDTTLPQEALDMIQHISDQVGSPSYVRTPTFAKSSRNKKPPTTIPYTGSSFTKVDGIDRNVLHIRGNLNKLSANNYDKVAPIICENIQLLMDNEVTNEELQKVTGFVFETASNNRFYSELYAKLFTELIERFPIFKTIFNESFDSYLKLYDNITSFSEADNYDEFCKQTAVNASRRAFTTFIVNLTLKKQVDNSTLFDLCWKLQSYFDTHILTDGQQPLCDELCENIFIIMTEGFKCLKDEERYASLNGKMTIVKNTKVKDVKSLSNKSLFRYYDMFDFVANLEK